MLNINIITQFPHMFNTILNNSIILKAREKSKVNFNLINLFDCLDNSQQRIDDYPFGGGDGMILKPDPIYNAIKYIVVDNDISNYRIIFPTPDG